MRAPGADVASLTSVVEEDARSSVWRLKGDLSEIWGGGELLSLEKENATEFERQNEIKKTTNNAQAMNENDLIHAKMIEIEPLLEALRERNFRTQEERPCLCLPQTVWFPQQSNLA